MSRKAYLSNRLTFLSVIISIFSVHVVCYPFWASCVSAALVYKGVSEEALRWMIYSSALIAMPSILIALPGIRRFGLASCTNCATILSVVGCALRAVAVAHGHGARRSTTAYIWVQVGSIVTCMAIAPTAICGSVIASVEESRKARLWKHTAVTLANPLGLAVGALLPEIIKSGPHLSAAEVDAVLLIFMSFAATAALAVGALLWRAQYLMEQDSEQNQVGACASQTVAQVLCTPASRHQPISEAPIPHPEKPHRNPCTSSFKGCTADIMPQLKKLLRTPKLVLVAVSFAFLIAPMLAALGSICIMLHDGEYLPGLPQKIILAAFVVACIASPFLMQWLFRDNKVGSVGLVIVHFSVLALALGYAFALAFTSVPEHTLLQALIATIAVAAAVSAALDLERAIDIMQRDQPAMVAGFMWLLAFMLAVMICGAQELVLFRPSTPNDETMQWWKWIMVLCFAVGAAASVGGVWVATNDPKPSAEPPRSNGRRGEGDSTTMEGSCTIDAMHSGSSHPKAVWWQNAAASSEGAPHDAVAYVLRSDH